MSKQQPKAVAEIDRAEQEAHESLNAARVAELKRLEAEALSAALRAWRCPACHTNCPEAYDIKKADPSDEHYAPRLVRCWCGVHGIVVPEKRAQTIG